MRNKFFALFVGLAFVMNGVGTVFADTKTNKKTNQSSALVALLPASDGVVTFDIQKILNEAVPQVLSGKPLMLADINRAIDDVRGKTGIDLRQFEQVVVGIALRQTETQELNIEPVVMARGKYNAGALLALGRMASNGKYREEKIGERTIYIFSGKEIVGQNKPQQTKGSPFDRAIDRMIENLSKEFAVASYDNGTLVFGSVARVRETFEGKTHVGTDVSDALLRKPNAAMSFSLNVPNGMSQFVKLDNDELGATLDAIRQVSGALEVGDNNAGFSVTAKTLKADQAQKLQQTLEGLQMFGKMALGSSKSADSKVFGRMIDNAKFSRAANEVTLDLQVPQSDINILLGVK